MESKRKRLKINNRIKLVLVIVAILIVALSLVITLGRYVYLMYRNHVLESQGFYFNSSVMSDIGANHSINNWDGVSAYKITIDVNNKKNDLLSTKTDIQYDIKFECSENIRCTVSKTEGTIRTATKTDSFIITFYPQDQFEYNQTAEVKVSATSNYPYVKELSATYNITITTSKFSYVITDHPNDKYLTLELINSATYYEVKEAFGSYDIGDKISIDDYNQLSADDKSKCYSANVTLNFDPNVILLDMTENNYLNNKDTAKTEEINGHNYVNEFGFGMEASSSAKIIFYKNDSTQDYSYPGNDNSIIEVTVDSVEE